MHPFLSAFAVAAIAALLPAQITYVDADLSTNTTLADGTPYSPPVGTLTGSGTDNEWLLRPYANGGTILSSHDVTGSNENAPMLRTRLSGLIPGFTYRLYSYWWSNGQYWRGRSMPAATQPPTTPSLPGYNTVHFSTSGFKPMQPLAAGAVVGSSQNTLGLSYDAAGMETSGHFTAPVMIVEGNRTMYETVLGEFTSNALGEIDVYIDDLQGSQPNSNRTWYDGVGYEWAPLPYGLNCGQGEIGLSGAPHVNANYSVNLTNGDPNALAVLVIGLNSIPPLDVGTIGFTPGCHLNVDLLLLNASLTDASGSASFQSVLGALPSATAVPIYFQWATFGAGFTLQSMTYGMQVEFHY